MKDLINEHKGFIVLVVLVSLILFNLIIVRPKEKVIESDTTSKTDKATDTYKRIKVDLKGCIKKPGVYEFLDYQRISDAIEKAGGLTEEADTSNINLSKVLEDEMVIYIYSKQEIEEQKSKEETLDNIEIIGSETLITTDEQIPEKDITNSKISINNASLEELMTLPKIGESKAKAIIEYRKQHQFTKLEELMEVSGIGEATYELLKDQIVL